MDFRNKYLLLTLRTLFGLMLLLMGGMGLFMAPPTEGLSEASAAALQGLDSLGIGKFIAVVEIIAGLLIITGFLPALGAVLVAPITVGIIVFHAVREPATIVAGIVFALFNIYLAYAYWDKFKPLFQR
jgi:uncharacterized membrane protein YphA (DoxX/SURF4 family)